MHMQPVGAGWTTCLASCIVEHTYLTLLWISRWRASIGDTGIREWSVHATDYQMLVYNQAEKITERTIL
ncbi:hypothetical protein AFLA_008002 [Aspergillus flavus NRRL3357]|nr:hypothetical protein AFLA_008002 [Aspergillus flavus NRRL3357]